MAKRLGSTENKDASLTKQGDKDSCDVNQIMKRYEKTGILPPYTTPGYFADVSEFGDFHRVTEVVRQTQEIFMQTPAEFRASFDNDVANFVNWATDPVNAAEVKLMIEGAEKAPVVPAPAGEPAPVAPAGA